MDKKQMDELAEILRSLTLTEFETKEPFMFIAEIHNFEVLNDY